MWSGAIVDIPSGWALCNGFNGTPDLRDRFVIGAHSDSDGQAKTTIRGIPEKTGGATYHYHLLDYWLTFDVPDDPAGAFDSATGYEEHLPPFYALAYIMKC